MDAGVIVDYRFLLMQALGERVVDVNALGHRSSLSLVWLLGAEVEPNLSCAFH